MKKNFNEFLIDCIFSSCPKNILSQIKRGLIFLIRAFTGVANLAFAVCSAFDRSVSAPTNIFLHVLKIARYPSCI